MYGVMDATPANQTLKINAATTVSNTISATNLSGTNTGDNAVNTTSNAYADILPKSHGVVTLPTITDNGNGSITLGTNGVCNFFTTADARGSLIKVACPTGATISMTDGSVNFVYADYNAGNPIY